jgi:hypothetical protein
MPRFNIFKAFRSSSHEKPVRETARTVRRDGHSDNEGFFEYIPEPHLRGRTMETQESGLNQTAPESVQSSRLSRRPTPRPSRYAAIEDYSGVYRDEELEIPHILEPVRPPSPIPTVRREESTSRLREIISDDGQTNPPPHPEVQNHDNQRYVREKYNEPQSGENNWLEDQEPPVLLRRYEDPIRDDRRVDNRYDENPYFEDHLARNEWRAPSDTSLAQSESHRDSTRRGREPGRSARYAEHPDSYPRHRDESLQISPVTSRQLYSQHEIQSTSADRDTYYIIPPGMDVIFQDEAGNEITRVGDFGRKSQRRSHRPAPIIIQDEYGREIYRTGDFDEHTRSSRRSRREYSDQKPKIIYLDPYVHSEERPK